MKKINKKNYRRQKKKVYVVKKEILTLSAVNVPTIKVETYPPIDDNVLARPKIVPEKLGAMSNPLPR